MTRHPPVIALLAAAVLVPLVALTGGPASLFAQDSQPPTPPKSSPETPAPRDPAEPDEEIAPTPHAPPAPAAPDSQTKTTESRERVDAQPGDDVVVVQNDGQRLEGLLVARTQHDVIIRIAGVEARIPKTRVERVILLDSAQARYRQMRSIIGDEDTARLIMLADWLQQRRMYVEALNEIQQVLSVNPNDGEALRRRSVLEQLVKLQVAAPTDPLDMDEFPPQRDAKDAPRRPTPAEFPVLRADQINLIKVYEVDTRSPPRLVIARPVIDRLLNEYADSPLIPSTREGREAFYRKSPAETLDIMFRVRARNLYEHVQVIDQPRSMRLFRDDVHSAWLINSCATTRCHGGSASGRLRLTNYRANSDEAVYTNFLILERFVTRSGHKLINYAEPEKSVLLQMGLPRDDALYPHPAVEGWKPIFRSRDARRFRDAIDWIRSMYRPRPEYPIDYTPPADADVGLPGPRPHEPVER